MGQVKSQTVCIPLKSSGFVWRTTYFHQWSWIKEMTSYSCVEYISLLLEKHKETIVHCRQAFRCWSLIGCIK
jgi:hypothetical protein